jgi:hypothetical protein
MVNLLLEKIEPIHNFDLKKAEYENIEGLALAYINATLIILFIYDNEHVDLESGEMNDFKFSKWLNIMQDYLKQVKIDTFGWYIFYIHQT